MTGRPGRSPYQLADSQPSPGGNLMTGGFQGGNLITWAVGGNLITTVSDAMSSQYDGR